MAGVITAALREVAPGVLVVWGTIAVLAAALAAALLVPAAARVPTSRSPGRWRSSRRAAPVVLGAVLTAVVLGAPGRLLVLATVLVAAAWAGSGLVTRRRRRRSAAAAADRVRETCEALASDLAAGRPTGVALDRAGEAWEPWRPVAAAHDVGADVADGLRTLATTPGCGDLRLVAAAWTVAHRTGHGLADAVARVADDVRSAQATRRVVASELASARSTARVLAVLPLAALLMGTGAGGDPWRFLLASEVGLACLAAGLALGLGGLWWIEALADDVEAGA